MAHNESHGRTEGETTGGPGRLADAPDILTVREVREILRIGRNQAYELIKSGRVRSCRIGGSIRVPRSALERFVGSGGLIDGWAGGSDHVGPSGAGIQEG